MKTTLYIALASILIRLSVAVHAQEPKFDKVQALKDTLLEMAKQPANTLFAKSCEWFVQVIESQNKLTYSDSSVLSATYDTFCLNNGNSDCRKYATYLDRKRPLTIAWESATDGKISFAELYLPRDWEPEAAYPLYIHLHGLSSTTHLPIDFLTRYFLREVNTSFGYEDGYYLLPWGRGNLWYQGISETDIFECRAAFESMVNIDLQRQYLKGHSMGGFGAWYIASHSPNMWAALGIEAGALWYGGQDVLSNNVIQQLKGLPTYFVVGTQDDLYYENEQAYNLLVAAGNSNAEFVTFVGGHERLDANEELLYLWMKDFINYDYDDIKNPSANKINDLSCFPNPCTKTTTLSFILEKSSSVKLSIYSSDGKHIETIITENLQPGLQNMPYSTVNLKSGIYFCRLSIGDGDFKNKILVKMP